MKTKLIFFVLSGGIWIFLSTSISSCQSEKAKLIQKGGSGPVVVISEFMCFNKKTIKDELDKSSDWIELSNLTNDTLFLEGYTITDNLAQNKKHTFTSGYIPPQNQKLFFASGIDTSETHLNFKLDKIGGEIILINPNGEVQSEVSYPKQFKDCSYLKVDGLWHYSKFPTPGKENNTKDFISGVAPPVAISFTREGDEIRVKLSATEQGKIKYTTNGSSVLSERFKNYKKPFLIDSTEIITAALFSESLFTKNETSAVYVNKERHSLPVLSLVTAPKNLWSDSTGIFVEGLFKNYENRSDSCERKGSIQYFPLKGEVHQQPISFKIYGAGTRRRPKKSMTIKPRGEGMPNWFFSSNDNKTIDGFVLRACYSDASRFKNEVVKGVNDIMNSDLLMQEYIPSALYINGQYWGLYNVYERKNDDFITAHTGKKVSHLLNGNSRQAKVEKGKNTSYVQFLDTINSVDIKSKEAFDLIDKNFELKSLLDFWVHELFTLKADRFNNRFWKSKEEAAKWSYVGYDFDIGFVWPVNPSTKRHFKEKDAAGIEIFNKCIQNPQFATHFFSRLSDYMNFGYTEIEVANILEQADSLTRYEFKLDFERWKEEYPKSLDKGDNQKKKIASFITPRSTYLRDSIAPEFGFDQQIIIRNSVPDRVDVFVNGFKLKEDAIYFNDMNISIELKAKSGEFQWEKDGKKVKVTTPISFSSSAVLELMPSN